MDLGLHLYSWGGVVVWPAFLVGSIVLYRRTRSRPALLLAAAAAITCSGKLTMFIFRNFPDAEMDGTGTVRASSIPAIFDVGLGLTGVGYVVFAIAFVAYALTRSPDGKLQK